MAQTEKSTHLQDPPRQSASAAPRARTSLHMWIDGVCTRCGAFCLRRISFMDSLSAPSLHSRGNAPLEPNRQPQAPLQLVPRTWDDVVAPAGDRRNDDVAAIPNGCIAQIDAAREVTIRIELDHPADIKGGPGPRLRFFRRSREGRNVGPNARPPAFAWQDSSIRRRQSGNGSRPPLHQECEIHVL
jgi:hypothetical protein